MNKELKDITTVRGCIFDWMQSYKLTPNENFFAIRKEKAPDVVWASYVLSEHKMMTACFRDNNLMFLKLKR